MVRKLTCLFSLALLAACFSSDDALVGSAEAATQEAVAPLAADEHAAAELADMPTELPAAELAEVPAAELTGVPSAELADMLAGVPSAELADVLAARNDDASAGSDWARDGAIPPGAPNDGLDHRELAQANDGEPPVPLADCLGPHPASAVAAPRASSALDCSTCLGSAAPDWALYDFQEISCGVGQYYGLSEFLGRPTLVVLLSAGCGYCLGQAAKLEELALELQVAGVDVNFVVVNQAGIEDRQQALVDRVSFALFQDTAEIGAWESFSGAKDDFFIYDSEGHLAAHYPARGTVETTLSIDEGYSNLRDALMHVAGNSDVSLPAGGNGGATEAAE